MERNLAYQKKKTFRYGRQYDLQQLPLMIKAGVKIMEAMRVVNMGMVKAAQRFVAVVEGGDYVWNMHRGDEVCV
jgi:type II secretory pathway component PulF